MNTFFTIFINLKFLVTILLGFKCFLSSLIKKTFFLILMISIYLYEIDKYRSQK